MEETAAFFIRFDLNNFQVMTLFFLLDGAIKGWFILASSREPIDG